MPKFSKKTYEAVAATLKGARPEDRLSGAMSHHYKVIARFTKLFKADNEKFDEKKFYTAAN